ncbi:tyrosine-type recombinase/integrase [Arthrobacter sp. efr-133-R2A-63]|uniref:tyrosine-type recombinase/integrase n=1 Tax=Arthrobacter sp. efr-133-R2A-63 TaxID=3040278 RepID=UPI00254CC98A|nr:tyrosine-type recombinase/integrase [Arthrobacter sp. efr-133-R2A-63]
MVRVQRVRINDNDITWTVLGDDLLPVAAIELFLEHLRQTGCSPNTVKSYARALQLWWQFLGLRNKAWDALALEDLTGFLAWIRTGIPPEVRTLHDPVEVRISDATAAVRLQGVRSFYLFHQWRGADIGPSLFSSRPARSPYKPFLGHARPYEPRAATVRVRRRRKVAPVLTPRQIEVIKDSCARFDAGTGAWTGALRDRLFFTLLEETGLRMGESLSLQHRDWHTGQGESPFIEIVPRPHPHGARVKGGNYRKLYISDGLDRLYAEYVWQLCDEGMDLAVDAIDEAHVFVNLHGPRKFAPMRPETIYKLVGRIRGRLGDNTPAAWTPHWFRHTHATALLLSGCPLHVVSRRLGHADVQTTLDIYAWVTEDEELRALAEWKTVTERWKDGHEIS